MLKGIQKKMVVLNIQDSKIFESAYFIMKNQVKLAPPDDNAVLFEANRIVSESLPKKKKGHFFLKFLLVMILVIVAAIMGRASTMLF